MVKNKIILLLCLFAFIQAHSKSTTHKYYVYFKDKVNSPFSIDKPIEFLSQKSIDRRVKFNIGISEQDLPVNQNYIKSLDKVEGVRIINMSKWLNAVAVELKDLSVLNKIHALTFVKRTQALTGNLAIANVINGTHSENNLNDLNSNTEISGHKYGNAFGQILLLNGLKLHKMGFKGQGMTIAVMDGGFYKVDELNVFDSLRAGKRILATKDFVNPNRNFYNTYQHGMNVMSCMASDLENRYIGTAPKSKYILMITEESGSEFPIEEANWVAAAEYADSMGADVINTSLGYSEYDDKKLSYKPDDMGANVAIASRGAEIATTKGMLVVIAAGNLGSSKWEVITTPSDAQSVITVGAVGLNREIASFSSRGNRVKEGIIKPTFSSPGKNIIVESGRGINTRSNGTSFASPILCGLVACLWQANPTKNPEEIKKAIQLSADMNMKPNRDYGYGIPDFYMAHAILGNNKEFDYSKDYYFPLYQVVLPNYIPIKFYSSKDQTIQAELLCITPRKNGKDKIKRIKNKTISVKSKQFLMDNLKIRKIKYKEGRRYKLIISTDGKVYEKLFK